MGSIVDKEVSLHGERMKENPDVPAQELVPQFEDYICDTTPNGKKKKRSLGSHQQAIPKNGCSTL